MGSKIDVMMTKLARVVVPRHVRIKDGRREDVDTYTYNRKGAAARPPLAKGRKDVTIVQQPDSKIRAGTREVSVIGLPKKKDTSAKSPAQQMLEDKRAAKKKPPQGTKENPIVTGDVNEAAKALGEGKHVRLTSEHKVSTLIEKLAELVADAKAKGKDAPNYDLCKVTVKDTNLFCVESKGIPRVEMPQLGGIPTPGSPADKFPKNKAGEVDLSEQFAKYLTENDVTGDGIPEVVDDVHVNASFLKASQNELGGAQVAVIAKSMEEKGIDPQRAWLWVSNDDYVIDGHHRWAAMVSVGLKQGKEVTVPTHRVDMDIISILAVANKWADEMGIGKAKLGGPVAELAEKLEDCGCG